MRFVSGDRGNRVRLVGLEADAASLNAEIPVFANVYNFVVLS